MKPLMVFFVLALAINAHAQDAIFTKAGDTITCKIISVNKNEIYFKKNDSAHQQFAPMWLVLKYEYNAHFKITNYYRDTIKSFIAISEPVELIDSSYILNSRSYYLDKAGNALSNAAGWQSAGIVISIITIANITSGKTIPGSTILLSVAGALCTVMAIICTNQSGQYLIESAKVKN